MIAIVMQKRGLVIAGFALAILGMANMAHVYAGPVVVINDIGCGMLDGLGNPISTTNSHVVETDRGNGNSMIWCKATGVTSGPGGKAVHWNYDNTGTLCSTNNGATDNWHAVVTPKGNAMLVCIYQNGK